MSGLCCLCLDFLGDIDPDISHLLGTSDDVCNEIIMEVNKTLCFLGWAVLLTQVPDIEESVE